VQSVSQLLDLSFTAYFEKDVNWNVVIKVERKATDLRVNVKAQGYVISCQLTCEDTAAGDKQIMSATTVNDINLGRVPSAACLYVFEKNQFTNSLIRARVVNKYIARRVGSALLEARRNM